MPKTFEQFLLQKYNKMKELSGKYPDNERIKLVYLLYLEMILQYNKFNSANLLKK